MTEPALGRGLETLLPRSAISAEMRDEAVHLLRLAQISPDPRQPRRRFSEGPLEELAQSISEHGVLQPILVRPDGDADSADRFIIVAGERRWRAAQRASLETIPAVIVDSAARPLTLALIENLQREDLNPIEAALGFQQLVEQGLSHNQIARQVGKSRTAVANALRLLQLPEDGRALLELGAISEGQARAVLAAPAEHRDELARRAAADSLTVRQLEAAARELAEPKPAKRRPPERSKPADPELAALAEAAQGALQTRVAIRPKRGGGGQLVIDWQSAEQLRHLIGQMQPAAPPSDDGAPERIAI